MEGHRRGKANESGCVSGIRREPWLVSCIALYIFTLENGEAQKKARLLVTEPWPPGLLALGSCLWSTVGLAREKLPEDPDGDSIKQ